jgi:FkbM family methyltransferase
MTSGIKETIRRFLPTRLKAHRIRGGALAGRVIYTSWHDYPGAIRGDTEAPLLAWFARHVKPGETWLDIGAHYGYTSIALSERVGNTGRVIAFEPVAATAGCIGRTRELNKLRQLQVVPFGLSSEPGIRPCRLPVYRGMADSTLARHGLDPPMFLGSFDDLWDSLSENDPRVDGAKIDVQGMELNVLLGMTGMLRRSHPRLVIEFHAGVDRAPVLDLLESCQYSRDPEAIEPGGTGLADDKSFAFHKARPFRTAF